jgi:uncharacterized protein (DUF2062 family)
MFARQTPRNRRQKMREAVLPSMGFYRTLRYYKLRMSRLNDSPYAVAAGFATGVAVSLTPFMGFHMVLAAFLVWLFRGSMMAMVLGTVLAGNPWTFPVIWYVTFKIGRAILGFENGGVVTPVDFSMQELMDRPLELLLPMSVGALPLICIFAPIAFYGARRVVKGMHDARRLRLQGASVKDSAS